jgi:hypothetical protein
MIYGNQFSGMDSLLARDYVNPNVLSPMCSQLHVCESLFGDWNARVCLLLQDPADVDSLKKFHKETGRPILSHNPYSDTNKRLVDWLNKFEMYGHLDIEGSRSNSCGLYYANAVWFLKRGGGMGAPLRQRKRVIEKSTEILVTTLTQLKEVELIIAFGSVAYVALQNIFHLKHVWPKALEGNSIISAEINQRRYLIGVTNHPKARGVSKDWMEQRLLAILQQWQSKFVQSHDSS